MNVDPRAPPRAARPGDRAAAPARAAPAGPAGGATKRGASGTAASDGAAFGCVAAAWQSHEAELRAFLRRRAADADAADDLLQDVFVKAMRQGQGFCRLDDPRAWLFQVARNALIDRARTEHPAEPLPEGDEEPVAPVPEPAPAVDALATCLERTLAELPADDQAILRACDLEGMNQRAFAGLHGLTLPAAKARLLRARRRLRDRLTTACRVRFDPADGRVCGHDGRIGAAPAPMGRDRPAPATERAGDAARRRSLL